MIARCTDDANNRYRRYGRRGISVCARWAESFDAFVGDVGFRPSPGHQIDRINNDGNYEPGNVRWATRQEQQRNKSDNRLITHNGETLTLIEWAEKTHIGVTTLWSRMRRGWTEKRALTTKPTATKCYLKFRGRTQSMKAWSAETGIPLSIISNRVARGWSTKRVLTTEPTLTKRTLTVNGRTQSMKAWAEESGLPLKIISTRINRDGWSAERALNEPLRKVRRPVGAPV